MANGDRIGIISLNFGCYVIYPSLEQAEAYVAATKKDDPKWNGYVAEIIISPQVKRNI